MVSTGSCILHFHNSQDTFFLVMKHDIHFHPFSMFHPFSFSVIHLSCSSNPLPSPIRALFSLSAILTSALPPLAHSQRTPNKEAPLLLAQHGLMISPKLPPPQRPRPCPPKDLLTGPICSPSNPYLFTNHPLAHPPLLRCCHPSPVSSSPRPLS